MAAATAETLIGEGLVNLGRYDLARVEEQRLCVRAIQVGTRMLRRQEELHLAFIWSIRILHRWSNDNRRLVETPYALSGRFVGVLFEQVQEILAADFDDAQAAQMGIYDLTINHLEMPLQQLGLQSM